jgi:hypothetical protein
MNKPNATADHAAQINRQVTEALDAIEQASARSRLTLRTSLKAGAAAMRPAVCYGCGPT